MLTILFCKHLFKVLLKLGAVVPLGSNLRKYALFQLPDEQVPEYVCSATALALLRFLAPTRFVRGYLSETVSSMKGSRAGGRAASMMRVSIWVRWLYLGVGIWLNRS